MMPSLMSGQEQVAWLAVVNEFARACEDGESSHAEVAARAIMVCLIKIVEVDVAADMVAGAARMVEDRIRTRQTVRDNIAQLWEDDDL